jgi:DNA-binding response OmpR family regulator
MTPELAQILFTGSAALLTALGLTAGARTNRARITRRQWRERERWELIARTYIHRLRAELADHGLPVPKAPPGLEDDDDDDDAAAARA